MLLKQLHKRYLYHKHSLFEEIHFLKKFLTEHLAITHIKLLVIDANPQVNG